MAKFHITIKDNEKGEIVADCETSCIVGAYADDDDGAVATMIVTHCTGARLAHTTYCAANAVQLVQEKNPEIATILAMRALTEKKGGGEE